MSAHSHKRTFSDEPSVRSLTVSSPSPARASFVEPAVQEDDGAPEEERREHEAVEEQAETPLEDVELPADEVEAARPSSADEQALEEAFEAVSLDENGQKEPTPASAPTSSSSPSPAPTSTPPLSPTTVATTVDAPSTSSIAASPLSPGLTADALADAAKPDATPKKQVSTKAPTTMQKVISFTRQRDLPPKDKEEEEKHLKQLAEMRAASKEMEKRRRSEAEARAAVRSAALASAFPAWEKAILPNWRVVLHDDSQGRHLRRLWWDGTMPVRYRGRLWALAIGNSLALGKNAFAQAKARAEKALVEGRLDEVKREAEEDVEGTLPALKLFQKGGVMHEELLDLLLAWSVYEKITPRYARGLAYPAALLLVNMPVAEAFVSLVNLVQKSFLRSFYSDDPAEEEAFYRVFDTLLADWLPRVYANFSAQVVRPSLYLRPWLSTLFVRFLPLDLSTRLFDVFLLEGDSFPFRVALILLQILEPRLFNPNLEDLAAVFAGEDKGAVAIVRREKGLLLPDGGAMEEKDGGIRVEKEDVYTEMGCTEERILALVQAQDWKEELWARLIERESPEAV
ncbi:hypothetical protein JCM8547_004789 [Rhodosporidiobolus lusitaniae]